VGGGERQEGRRGRKPHQFPKPDCKRIFLSVEEKRKRRIQAGQEKKIPKVKCKTKTGKTGKNLPSPKKDPQGKARW